jgi:serine/threonine protein kinase
MIANDYHIELELGSQKKRKFGRVFQVVSKKDPQKKGILKTLKKNNTNIHLQERLRNEALFSFDHPSLPKVHEFEESENEILLLMDYKEGCTLDVFWNSLKRKERIENLKTVILGLVPALNELKMRGIVHCDIKPSNILIHSQNGSTLIHLIDFGLALDRSQQNQRSTLFPLGFAAPELILNQLDCVDHTTDLYALGITIWRTFTGSLPLTHPNPSIFTNLQLVHPLPQHTKIPTELWNILNKMCMKFPFKTAPNLMQQSEIISALSANNALRYQDIEEVIKELHKL